MKFSCVFGCSSVKCVRVRKTRGEGFTLWLLVVFRDGVPTGYLPLKHTAEQVLGLQASKVTFLVLHDTEGPHLVGRAETSLK